MTKKENYVSIIKDDIANNSFMKIVWYLVRYEHNPRGFYSIGDITVIINHEIHVETTRDILKISGNSSVKISSIKVPASDMLDGIKSIHIMANGDILRDCSEFRKHHMDEDGPIYLIYSRGKNTIKRFTTLKDKASTSYDLEEKKRSDDKNNNYVASITYMIKEAQSKGINVQELLTNINMEDAHS